MPGSDVVKLIADLRTRLLDLSNSNKLLNYKHSERARTQVRIIDEQPDFIHKCLTTDRPLTFCPLPEPDIELPDEKTDTFLMFLEEARLLDKAWKELLSEDEDPTSAKALKLDRQIRDRVREQLGLPPTQAGRFASIQDWARLHGIEPSFELPPPSLADPGERQQDKEIQTLLYPDDLQAKLAGVLDHAHTALQEMGVNILHLAVGFLEWFEAPTAEKPMLAPLLLYPVEMTYKATPTRGQYTYTIRGNQDPVINLTLRERLKKDFGLVLPEIDEEQDTAESYLGRVAAVIRNNDLPRWKVRRFGTLGLFSFSRLAMYADLAPARWGGEDTLVTQGVLGKLFSSQEGGDWAAPQEYDLEDPGIDTEVPLLILDADASQHHAIIEVLRGRSLVIKGPPGTGKSQTIANIIAATLAKGKTVLFVAEKAAALDVVKKRLDGAKWAGLSLGDFCLEVHSTKAKKLEVLASLRRRLSVPRPRHSPDLAASVADHLKLRRRFTHHAETLNSPFGALDLCERGAWRQATVHDILWAEQRGRDRFKSFQAIERRVLSNAVETTRQDAERRRMILQSIQTQAREFIAAYGSPGQHPWSVATRRDLTFLDMAEILDHLGAGSVALNELVCHLSEGGGLFGGKGAPGSLFACEALGRDLANLPTPPEEVEDTLLRLVLGPGQRVEELTHLVEAITRCQSLMEACRERLAPGGSLAALDLPEIRNFATLAVQEGLGGYSLVELPELAKLGREELDRQLRGLGLARRILSIIGLAVPQVTRRTVERLREALELLSTVDRQAILARSPQVMDELAQPALLKAQAQLEPLRQQDQHLRKTLVLEAGLAVSQVRNHARILRSTGFWGRFSTEFRTVKRACFAIDKRTAPFDCAAFARRLDELADYLEARDAFETSVANRAIFCDRFLGLDTDVDAMLAANRLASTIRTSFPRLDDLDRAIRGLILESDLETVTAFQAFNADPDLPMLGSLLQAEPDFDLEQGILRREAVVTAAEALYRGLGRMGLRNDITPQAAGKLAIDLEVARRLEQELVLAPWVGLIPPDNWKGMDTETTSLFAALAFAEAGSKAGTPPEALAYLLGGSDPLHTAIPRLQEYGRVLVASCSAVRVAVQGFLARVVELTELPGSLDRFTQAPPIDGVRWLEAMVASSDQFMAWTTFCAHLAEARQEGLAAVLEACGDIQTLTRIPVDLTDIYERMLCRTLAQQVLSEHPELLHQPAGNLDQARRRFRSLDATIQEVRLQQLLGRMILTPIPSGVRSQLRGECTEVTLIQNELEKKSRHIPIRDLFARASEALKAMKPCMMMSPASVAQFLKPDHTFDLVIIDEASQVRPEEALGAMARSCQAVIVGDSQQLPPTNFFQRQAGEGNTDDEEDYEGVLAESILDIAVGAFHPARELLWHYRSRHGSLIAFSNRHFYDDRLVVFPSPQEGIPEYGVRHVFVPGTYRASVNIREAQVVAQAALDFMVQNRDRSLGIVALNQPQRDLILAEMERTFVRDGAARAYRERWVDTLEPFFVKNLENVQGDERDVVFISTVYGPDASGALMQRFGPINGAAGHRRLNVLFSRAKHGVTVFTSMRPDLIRVDPATSLGTRLLRDYLLFAATGRLDSGQALHSECDSDFEIFVKERLEARGYKVVAQVGVAGFRIDLGLSHPNWPYGFLLGIECDGAAYHSSRSARDRDHLRQKVLENLGWTIYRVWSTDWFRDPAHEMAKMVEYIESALRARIMEHARAAQHPGKSSASTADGTEREDEASEVDSAGTNDATSGPGQGNSMPDPDPKPSTSLEPTIPPEWDHPRPVTESPRNDLHRAPVTAELRPASLEPRRSRREFHPSVRIGDQVSFAYLDNLGEILTFRIGDQAGDGRTPALKPTSPLAKALLGLAVGETKSIMVAGHSEGKLKVTGINKIS